jgi:trans-aconitate 2-methyltransferase
MDNWNPDKYLMFKNERTQPAIDLVEKIVLDNPRNIIDIGCGPGNSAQILANKWKNSIVTGLDSSKAMIERARSDYPNQIWIHEKAENITLDKKYSLVFSNAALQWMDDHEKLLPKLWELVDDHGAFAAQIPKFKKMPASIAINNVLEKDKWNKYFNKSIMRLYELDYYYELLSKLTGNIVLWETHYYHILPSMRGIIDFIHSTALNPYLAKMDNDAEKDDFKNDILDECKKYYKEQSNGKVLFPFQRLFMIGYKK